MSYHVSLKIKILILTTGPHPCLFGEFSSNQFFVWRSSENETLLTKKTINYYLITMHWHSNTNPVLTLKGSISHVARNSRRWKFDMADRKSSGENWFKYLTKALKSCAEGNKRLAKHSSSNQNYRYYNLSKCVLWLQRTLLLKLQTWMSKSGSVLQKRTLNNTQFHFKAGEMGRKIP